MASRKRYAAYIRSIKTLPDFGWTEKTLPPKPGSILYQTIYELNGCIARFDLNFWSVERNNGQIKGFETIGKSLAQIYQDMTDYALGKED